MNACILTGEAGDVGAYPPSIVVNAQRRLPDSPAATAPQRPEDFHAISCPSGNQISRTHDTRDDVHHHPSCALVHTA
jgi:hypothetical protein